MQQGKPHFATWNAASRGKGEIKVLAMLGAVILGLLLIMWFFQQVDEGNITLPTPEPKTPDGFIPVEEGTVEED